MTTYRYVPRNFGTPAPHPWSDPNDAGRLVGATITPAGDPDPLDTADGDSSYVTVTGHDPGTGDPRQYTGVTFTFEPVAAAAPASASTVTLSFDFRVPASPGTGGFAVYLTSDSLAGWIALRSAGSSVPQPFGLTTAVDVSWAWTYLSDPSTVLVLTSDAVDPIFYPDRACDVTYLVLDVEAGATERWLRQYPRVKGGSTPRRNSQLGLASTLGGSAPRRYGAGYQ